MAPLRTPFRRRGHIPVIPLPPPPHPLSSAVESPSIYSPASRAPAPLSFHPPLSPFFSASRRALVVSFVSPFHAPFPPFSPLPLPHPTSPSPTKSITTSLSFPPPPSLPRSLYSLPRCPLIPPPPFAEGVRTSGNSPAGKPFPCHPFPLLVLDATANIMPSQGTSVPR